MLFYHAAPPQRRPEASWLLAALADPKRGFDTVAGGGAEAGVLRQLTGKSPTLGRALQRPAEPGRCEAAGQAAGARLTL